MTMKNVYYTAQNYEIVKMYSMCLCLSELEMQKKDLNE